MATQVHTATEDQLREALAELLLRSSMALQRLQMGDERAGLRDAVLRAVLTLEETR